MKSLRGLLTTGSVLLLASTAPAGTIYIDDDGGPGVDFTDIQPAVNAAQAGDVLLVMSGTYNGFMCNKAITIVGYMPATVDGAWVTGVPAGERPCVLYNLDLSGIRVTDCHGPVIVNRSLWVERIIVANSADVRLQSIIPATQQPLPGQYGMSVVGSRVEMAGCGARGTPGTCGVDGGAGLIADGSRIHFAMAGADGGKGGNCSVGTAGDGGPGVVLTGGSTLIATRGTIRGGHAGVNLNFNCAFNGRSGPGLIARDSVVDYSLTDVLAPDWTQKQGCFTFRGELFVNDGSSIDQVDPPGATLESSGSLYPNESVTLRLKGPVGSRARIWFGRKWILQPEPGVDVELMVNRLQEIELGAIPASGTVTYVFPTPPGSTPGMVFGVQGECVTRSGLVRRSNSLALVRG